MRRLLGSKDKCKEGIDGEPVPMDEEGQEMAGGNLGDRKCEEKRKGNAQLLKGHVEGINWKKKKEQSLN